MLGDSLNEARRLETLGIPDSQVFDIPDLYDKFTKRNSHVLLLVSSEQPKTLLESSIVLMDGTFSVL